LGPSPRPGASFARPDRSAGCFPLKLECGLVGRRPKCVKLGSYAPDYKRLRLASAGHPSPQNYPDPDAATAFITQLREGRALLALSHHGVERSAGIVLGLERLEVLRDPRPVLSLEKLLAGLGSGLDVSGKPLDYRAKVTRATTARCGQAALR